MKHVTSTSHAGEDEFASNWTDEVAAPLASSPATSRILSHAATEVQDSRGADIQDHSDANPLRTASPMKIAEDETGVPVSAPAKRRKIRSKQKNLRRDKRPEHLVS